MIEVLVEGMTNNKGGKETYLVNVFMVLDKSKYNVTFIAYDEKIAYENILKEKGAKILHLPPRYKGLKKHRMALNKVFEDKKYDVVWAHKTTLSACEILSIAKKNDVALRIVHSHSSSNMGSKFTFIMHSINRKLIFRWANEYLACSEVAAQWFYGKHPAKILTNVIDINEFKFNLEVRDRIRKDLRLKDKFVIGHVGRFGKEKNHNKLVAVFAECKKKDTNVKLVLCGDGEERKRIEQQIKKLKLQDDIILLGMVDNVNEILQAMDILVMPSYFEGLPFAVLEAQAAGLKCIVSDTISVECNVLEWNTFLPLNESSEFWAETILKNNTLYDRKMGYVVMREKGFDMQENVHKIESIIEGGLKSFV